MASTSAGKLLVETDCTQHNPLVDLSRRIIEGNVDNDFGKTWDQSMIKCSKPQNVSISGEV